MIAPAESSRVAENHSKSSKRRSREQRRLERERQRRMESQMPSRLLPSADAAFDEPAEAPAAAPGVTEDPKPEASVRPGLFKRLFGRPDAQADAPAAAPAEPAMPSVLRPIARREYGHERTLSTIRHGFEDLSDLMCDIRDGLEASVEKQAELLDQLRFLPVIAEQNARSGERLERQLQAQNQIQAETLKAVREQARAQNEQLGGVLGALGKQSRDQKRDIDDMETRLERMRHSEQAIADNLSTVGTAVRKVSEQTAKQGELSARMQRALDERTRELETALQRQSRRQGTLIAIAALLAAVAVTAVGTIGYFYLKQTGAL